MNIMLISFLLAAIAVYGTRVIITTVGDLRLKRIARRTGVPVDILRLAKAERRRWRPMQMALRAAGVPLNDVIIPENWPTLLLPGLRKIWHTRLRSREALFRADKIFKKDTSQRAFEEYQGVGELGSDGWTEFDKFRKVPYGGFEPNYKATLRHKTYAKGIMVEREMLEDNLYPQAGIPKSLTQRVEKLADSAAVFREKAAADVLNNAFTDTGISAAGFSVSGPDGVGLVSTAHPLSPTNASTQSNEFTVALDAAGLTTVRAAMQRWTDDKGDIVSINPDTLIVPPALEDTALALVNSELVLGSNNNDPNPHKGRYEVIVWPYLTDTNAWFLADSVLMDEHLIWLDRVLPEWQTEGDFDTIMAKYRGYMRFSVGWDAWQWIAGSNPS